MVIDPADRRLGAGAGGVRCYKSRDATALCSPASVTVAVHHVFRAPVVTDDNFETRLGMGIALPVLENDVSLNGAPFDEEVTILVPPSNGFASEEADGTIEYSPVPAFSGVDSLVYQICESIGLWATASFAYEVCNTAHACATSYGVKRFRSQ